MKKKKSIRRGCLTVVCGSVSGNGWALRFTRRSRRAGTCDFRRSILRKRGGKLLILVYKSGDASRLDPAYKQPAWDGAAGLVQYHPSRSFVLGTRRRISHARMGASSDIVIRIRLRVSTVLGRRGYSVAEAWNPAFGQPTWHSRYADRRDHGSLHHLFASSLSRKIRVCL